jgi:hypothetical protein
MQNESAAPPAGGRSQPAGAIVTTGAPRGVAMGVGFTMKTPSHLVTLVTIVAGSIVLAIGAQFASAQTTAILGGLVEVTAEAAQSDGGDYVFNLTVSSGDDSYRLETGIIGVRGRQKALAKLRSTIGWKGSYLFVRTECGGGNAWRCCLDNVYRVLDGHLVALGAVWAFESPLSVGPSFADGMFVDVYDALEGNGLTCHALAPSIWLAKRERSGALEAVADATWRLNNEQFSANRRLLQRASRERRRQDDDERTRAAVLFNATLAKLSGRASELTIVRELAARLLSVDEAARLDADLSRVVPIAQP